MHTDTPSSFGCGEWTGDWWLKTVYPNGQLPIVMATLPLGQHWSTEEYILIMHLLQCIFLDQLITTWATGETNVAADAISRNNLALFFT